MKLLPFIFAVITLLPSLVFAFYGSGGGLILYTSDQKTRSGVLSSDHRCTDYPEQFKASHVKNTGSSHCALWSDTGCRGTLHVVPAHYMMRIPNANFKSVIC